MKPNSVIWGMFFSVLFFSLYYLINAAILSNRYIIFFKSSSKYLFNPKRKIEQKLLSHNCEFADWLASYGIANSSKFWKVGWKFSLSICSVHVLELDWAWILSAYFMDNTLEKIDNSLERLELDAIKQPQPLVLFISIFIVGKG